MKHQESFQPQEKSFSVVLTEEQKANNPNNVMEKFFEAAYPKLVSLFEEISDAKGNPREKEEAKAITAAKKEIKTMVREDLPKSKRGLINDEDMIRSALRYYAEKHQGFGKAKGLEQKYKEMCEQKLRKFAEKEAEGMKELEYEEAARAIEDSVAKLIGEDSDIKENPDDITAFRNTLWELYEAKKVL